MVNRASGTFEVKLTPLALNNAAGTEGLARMALDKQFKGELEATSQGEMLSAGTNVPDSAGYVAIERVSGSLHGRKGSFIFQHSATMNRGVPQLSITVVPDSGTEELSGLTGQMAINITEGQHFYEFEYTLP